METYIIWGVSIYDSNWRHKYIMVISAMEMVNRLSEERLKEATDKNRERNKKRIRED
jgi:hypothetical protein